ncbi:MAG: DUF4342 domain-containing protein [Gammaproteobacteria bacterium]|nr:DUF4342 domain-containing protein [Gammaproteobacteria bacterium]
MARQQTWTEVISIGGRQLARTLNRLAAQGNIKRLVITKPNGKIFFQTTLTQGVAIASVLTILAPALTAVCAMAALLSEIRVKIVHRGKPPRNHR